MNEATICFYANPLSPACWAVRLYTRRKDQKISDVPAHTAIILLVEKVPTLYEFISTGWRSRPAVDSDYIWSKNITLTNLEAAQTFCESCRGQKYDWLTIFAIFTARFVPDRWLSRYRSVLKRICSWFVDTALLQGGWVPPLWEQHQYVSISPNDVWFAVRNS